MKWINSKGPLILMPNSKLNLWYGIFSESNSVGQAEFFTNGNGFYMGGEETDTHYNKAVSLKKGTGLIEVNKSKYLLIGGDPNRTAWISAGNKKQGMFVRWVYAPESFDIKGLLKNLPKLNWKEQFTFLLNDEESILFEAVDHGEKITGDFIKIELQLGTYKLYEDTYKSEVDEVCLDLIKLELI